MGPVTFYRQLKNIILSRPRIPPDYESNALLGTILNRRSIRKFSAKDIPAPALEAILEAGRLAPSSVNLQTWSFFILNPQEWKHTFGKPLPFHGSRAVIVCGDIHRNRPVFPDFPSSPLVEYTLAVMNASLAAMNMNIAAESLGISSVMLSETGEAGFFFAENLIKTLNLPQGVFPLMTIILGYARGGYPPMPPKIPPEFIKFKDRYLETPAQVMTDWFAQMTAGYKATFPLKSFQGQMESYQKNLENAENTLMRIVFSKDSSPPGSHSPGDQDGAGGSD